MKVLIYTKYNTAGPSSRYRTYQYLPLIKEAGLSVKVCYLFGEKYLDKIFKHKFCTHLVLLAYLKRLINLLYIPFCRLIIIEYELFPYMPGVLERILGITGKKYILDYDDAIFHKYDGGGFYKRIALKSKIPALIKRSQFTIAANKYIYDYALSFGTNIALIPTSIRCANKKGLKKTGSHEKIVLGWIGTPGSSFYLLEFKDAWERIKKRNIILRLIGADDLMMENFTDENVEFVSWNKLSEYESIAAFDIGIMPLPDTPWTRGKSGFKIIQYMSVGIPAIASGVGENINIIQHGITGFLANNTEDWIKYYTLLSEDAKLRQEMGQRAKRVFEENYSIEKNSKKYINIIKNAIY